MSPRHRVTPPERSIGKRKQLQNGGRPTEPKSEKWVKAQVRALFVAHGVERPYMPSSGIGRNGAADFIECIYGRYIAIETKKKGNKPTELQLLFGAGIRERGGHYWIIYEDGLPFVRDMFNAWRIDP